MWWSLCLLESRNIFFITVVGIQFHLDPKCKWVKNDYPSCFWGTGFFGFGFLFLGTYFWGFLLLGFWFLFKGTYFWGFLFLGVPYLFGDIWYPQETRTPKYSVPKNWIHCKNLSCTKVSISAKSGMNVELKIGLDVIMAHWWVIMVQCKCHLFHDLGLFLG